MFSQLYLLRINHSCLFWQTWKYTTQNPFKKTCLIELGQLTISAGPSLNADAMLTLGCSKLMNKHRRRLLLQDVAFISCTTLALEIPTNLIKSL